MRSEAPAAHQDWRHGITRAAVVLVCLATAAGLAGLGFLLAWGRVDAGSAPREASAGATATTSIPRPGAITPIPPPAASGSAAVFDAVDRAVERLVRGQVAFNSPATLPLGETAQIQLRLSPALTIRKLEEAITAVGRRQGAEIRLSDEMEARLSGLGFTIAALSPERQAVSGSGATGWDWAIQPTETGRQHLHLTLVAVIDIRGHQSQRTVYELDRVLTIHVTWYHRVSSFASGNWQWLWAAILVPATGFVAGLRRRRSSAAGETPRPPRGRSAGRNPGR
jgi:hypothetical protein